MLAVGVAGLQLQMNNVEFLLCELLLETGDVGLRLEFGDAVAKAALAVERVDLGLLRVVEGAGSVGGGFLGLGAARSVEEVPSDLNTEYAFVRRELIVVECLSLIHI